MHGDTLTVAKGSMADYTRRPNMDDDSLIWRDHAAVSGDASIVSTINAPFLPKGGFRILYGNLGRACIKVSAVERDR